VRRTPAGAAEALLKAIRIAALVFVAAPAQAAISVDTTRIGHGVHAWYSASQTVPVVDIQISFEGAGYASDPAGKEGRASLAASMLTEGAGPLDALAFQQALEDGAITLSASSDADRLTIHIHALREQAVRAGELLAMALKEPRFAEDDLARVKAETATMLVQLNESPQYRGSRLLANRAFAGHPYANAPYGTASSLAAISAEDLRNYFTTYATRSNVKISAAGDVDSGLLNDVLDPVVEALHDTDVESAVAPITLRGGGEQLHETMPVPQTVVLFAAPGVARSDPRFYAASMLNYALGGDGLISRLARGVRQEKGLVYSIGTGLDVKRGSALITGQLATRNASAADAVTEVKHVLEETRAKGLTTQECDDARTYVLGSQLLRLDSSSDVAGTLLMMQVYDLGEDYLEKRESYFNKVSCADVNALAAELLNPSRFLFAVVGGTAP
jgi:zinc protease